MNAKWIKGTDNCIFKKDFFTNGNVKKAELAITAMGVYEVSINGVRVGDYILPPGFTSYNKRTQVQRYDITNMLEQQNIITVGLGNGWYRGAFTLDGNIRNRKAFLWEGAQCIIAEITLTYSDGSESVITDESWQYAQGNVLFSEIYDGETYDANVVPDNWQNVSIYDFPKDMLIEQEGPIVKEREWVKPTKLLTTPKGEKVLDFGQNLTGYIEFTVNAKKGDKVVISHAEVLDKDGNFYTGNLRGAKQLLTYICKDGQQSYKPKFSFMGFRYIRLDEFPAGINPDDFTAVVVYSDIERTGYFECSNPLLNKLFENVVWGQKGNFLDIPTDCPQRDERLGWTGDAQVFVKTASYIFNVHEFFIKWLKDLAADQYPSGNIPHVVPETMLPKFDRGPSFGWGDAAVICPWQIYLTYNDRDILQRHFDSMKAWIACCANNLDATEYGDWLGLDAAEGSYKGASDERFVNRAFHVYSIALFIKIGKIIGKDIRDYEQYHKIIVDKINAEFTPKTQTELALSLFFDITPNKTETAATLAKAVVDNGNKIATGFLGTPYILHALSQNGYAELAYTLLLQEAYPSWLYPVHKGATTIWEHWDSIKPDGSFWSPDMNSFNHYAYGAVADWMYEVVAGIKIDEDNPGFENVILQPTVDKRLQYASASVKTAYGEVSSRWKFVGDKVKYNFVVPNRATIVLDGEAREVERGEYEMSI